MKLFRCTCEAALVLHFENTRCGYCQRPVGFDPRGLMLAPRAPAGSPMRDEHAVHTDEDGARWRACANRARHAACNWMVPADRDSPWCEACARNVIVPDLSVPQNVPPWRTLEAAKRRCLYTLLQIGLPLDATDGMPPLRFRILSDRDARTDFEHTIPGSEPVMTGHRDGVVTINLAEADVVARTRMQASMAERYRTPLGHFRHETGHYAFDRLAAKDAGFRERARACFGDERSDYAAALDRHYREGPPHDWQARHVSPYASMHPFEDWAETWSHYLHIIDTLETYQAFVGESALLDGAGLAIPLPFAVGVGAPADLRDVERMMSLWVEASVMLNGLNRSMGLPDPYPFVIGPVVRVKLGFVHAELMGLHSL